MIDPRFEEQSVPEMLRQVVERMGDMEDGSAEQVLYLSLVLPIIHYQNVEELVLIPAVRLGQAHERLESGLL